MADRQDGGPAFPGLTDSGMARYDEATDTVQPVFGAQGGMTLRDWFAGQALMGIFAAYAHPSSPGLPVAPEAATRAYEAADAMLKQREPR